MTALAHKTFTTAEAETRESETRARGAFLALGSTFGPEPDRQGDLVKRGAFARSLEDWTARGSMIPVLADHAGEIGSVVGHVDPRFSVETARGLEVAGTFDLSTSLSKRVYELVKRRSLFWSTGFTVPEGGRRRRGKVTELTEIDLAEISVVPVHEDRTP